MILMAYAGNKYMNMMATQILKICACDKYMNMMATYILKIYAFYVLGIYPTYVFAWSIQLRKSLNYSCA